MPKSDWKKNSIPVLFPKLGKVESVLDVACGLSLKSKYIPAKIRVGVDIYPEYFKFIEAKVPYVVIKHDVRSLDYIFMPKSFDVVIAFDIIEHLNKSEGWKLLAQCEEIARRAVIIETPEGYIPQNIDITGHGGDKYQTHKSGWTAKEFKSLGYQVKKRPYRMNDVKRNKRNIKVDPNIVMLNAIKWLKS